MLLNKYLSWLHLKLISVHIAARLRTTWAVLFWPTHTALIQNETVVQKVQNSKLF